VDPEPTPAPDQQIVRGRIAFPSQKVVLRIRREPGRLRYGTKSGLLVRHGATPVDLIVPSRWRKRFAIGRGFRPTSTLRILGCPTTPPDWWSYAGGYSVRSAACVPLVVRVDGVSTTIHLPLGRACPTA
jgi:hypothetical protein